MTNRTFGRVAVLALAMLAPVLMIACGGGGEELSRADVAEIVRSELEKVPDPEPGLTGEEVEQIVVNALAGMKDTEAAGEKAEQMAEAKMSAMPRRSDPSEYTQYLVKKAIGMYEAEGLDATLAYYNTRESIDGQWYVFIGDGDVLLAHAANPRLGQSSRLRGGRAERLPGGRGGRGRRGRGWRMVLLHLPQSRHRRRGDQALLDGAATTGSSSARAGMRAGPQEVRRSRSTPSPSCGRPWTSTTPWAWRLPSTTTTPSRASTASGTCSSSTRTRRCSPTPPIPTS